MRRPGSQSTPRGRLHCPVTGRTRPASSPGSARTRPIRVSAPQCGECATMHPRRQRPQPCPWRLQPLRARVFINCQNRPRATGRASRRGVMQHEPSARVGSPAVQQPISGGHEVRRRCAVTRAQGRTAQVDPFERSLGLRAPQWRCLTGGAAGRKIGATCIQSTECPPSCCKRQHRAGHGRARNSSSGRHIRTQFRIYDTTRHPAAPPVRGRGTGRGGRPPDDCIQGSSPVHARCACSVGVRAGRRGAESV